MLRRTSRSNSASAMPWGGLPGGSTADNPRRQPPATCITLAATPEMFEDPDKFPSYKPYKIELRLCRLSVAAAQSTTEQL